MQPARLQVGDRGCCVCARCWGWLFWLVRMQRSGRWDLRTDVEGRDADALVLRFVVACGGGGAVVNEQGGFGTAAVGCVRAITSGGGACGGDNAVGVAEAVGDDGVVVAAAAFDDDVGTVDVAGGAVRVAFAVAAVGSGVGVVVAIGADGAVGIDDVGCLVGFAVVIVGVGVGGVGSVSDAGRAVDVGVVAASVAICGSGVEGAGGVDEAGNVVGGVAATAVGIDVSGACGTDGAGIVDDVCVAVAVVVNGVIFIVEVQSQVSRREVGAEEASVGGRAC